MTPKNQGAKYTPKNCGKAEGGELTEEQFECLDNSSIVGGSSISAFWFQPKPKDNYKKNFRMQRGQSAEGWCFTPDFEDNTDDEMDEASMLRSTSIVMEGASNLLFTSAVAFIAVSLY